MAISRRHSGPWGAGCLGPALIVTTACALSCVTTSWSLFVVARARGPSSMRHGWPTRRPRVRLRRGLTVTGMSTSPGAFHWVASWCRSRRMLRSSVGRRPLAAAPVMPADASRPVTPDAPADGPCSGSGAVDAPSLAVGSIGPDVSSREETLRSERVDVHDDYGAVLIRLAKAGVGAAHRLLGRLAETDLVTVTRSGNQKHYQAIARARSGRRAGACPRRVVGRGGETASGPTFLSGSSLW